MKNTTTLPLNIVIAAKGDAQAEVIAEEKICVECGCQTTDIPRFDYTVAENIENDFKYPTGGYYCEPCDENIYEEAHLGGSSYCPSHGFIESYFNQKDDKGNFVGCYEGCPAAAEYDREVTEKHKNKQ